VTWFWTGTDSEVFSELTNTSGFITQQELVEYVNDDSLITYSTPYTVNVSFAGFDTNSSSINLTTNYLLEVFFDTSAAFTLNKTANASSFLTGQNITWTITINNTGLFDISVNLTDSNGRNFTNTSVLNGTVWTVTYTTLARCSDINNTVNATATNYSTSNSTSSYLVTITSCGNGRCDCSETCSPCRRDCGKCPVEDSGGAIKSVYWGPVYTPPTPTPQPEPEPEPEPEVEPEANDTEGGTPALAEPTATQPETQPQPVWTKSEPQGDNTMLILAVLLIAGIVGVAFLKKK
jgi:hypothetical protein